MKSKAAVLYGAHQPFQIEEIEVDDPKENEVLVHLKATGLCHSDWHVVEGDLPVGHFPMVLGHEGAGVVEKVGPGVKHVEPGDHVVLTFIPPCGRCWFCVNGQTQLCDQGAGILAGPQLDGTFRLHKGDQDIGQFCMISTFSEYTVAPADAVVKIDKDYPLERACLVGCGVATGFGAAVNRAGIEPGSTVLVIGCGGIGTNVIQGARAAGARMIIACDIHDSKLEQMKQFGATHTVNNEKEDLIERVMELTNGLGVDYAFEAIATPVTIGQAFDATRKGGTTVVIGLTPYNQETIPVNPFNLVLFEKSVLGTLYGSSNPHNDIPRYLSLYRSGQIDLDGLVTKEYSLEQINEGYQDMLSGRNIRGVVRYW